MSKELLELLHQVNVNKYSQSDPKGVLLSIINDIRMKTGHYGFRCWELMVECLAKWLVLNQKTGFACMVPLQGFKGIDLKKDDLYTYLEDSDYFQHYYTAAMAKPWDYIGELYEDLGLVDMGQNMTPRGLVEMMIQMTYGRVLDGAAEWLCYNSFLEYVDWYRETFHVPPTHLKWMDPPLHTQLDPCVGTGRFLFVASQMMPKANLVLFGIEINLALYRACLVNMAMFSNHPFSIICADTLRIDAKSSDPTSKLWDFGNQWTPPDITPFYWKPPPINAESFSLKAFTELPKEST